MFLSNSSLSFNPSSLPGEAGMGWCSILIGFKDQFYVMDEHLIRNTRSAAIARVPARLIFSNHSAILKCSELTMRLLLIGV